MIPVNNYYLQFLAKMNNTATAMLAQNGAFISQCETHCEALGGGWDSFMVGGVSMRDAVAAWMADPAPTPQKHLCVAPRAQPPPLQASLARGAPRASRPPAQPPRPAHCGCPAAACLAAGRPRWRRRRRAGDLPLLPLCGPAARPLAHPPGCCCCSEPAVHREGRHRRHRLRPLAGA
jgi:hypothetical protein